jgi:hypothetical protein
MTGAGRGVGLIFRHEWRFRENVTPSKLVDSRSPISDPAGPTGAPSKRFLQSVPGVAGRGMPIAGDPI